MKLTTEEITKVAVRGKECWINVYYGGDDHWYGLCYPYRCHSGPMKLLYRIHVRLK